VAPMRPGSQCLVQEGPEKSTLLIRHMRLSVSGETTITNLSNDGPPPHAESSDGTITRKKRFLDLAIQAERLGGCNSSGRSEMKSYPQPNIPEDGSDARVSDYEVYAKNVAKASGDGFVKKRRKTSSKVLLTGGYSSWEPKAPLKATFPRSRARDYDKNNLPPSWERLKLLKAASKLVLQRLAAATGYSVATVTSTIKHLKAVSPDLMEKLLPTLREAFVICAETGDTSLLSFASNFADEASRVEFTKICRANAAR